MALYVYIRQNFVIPWEDGTCIAAVAGLMASMKRLSLIAAVQGPAIYIICIYLYLYATVASSGIGCERGSSSSSSGQDRFLLFKLYR